MEVLLTGATGFIGSRLLGALLDEGHRVRALVRRPVQIGEVERAVTGTARAQANTKPQKAQPGPRDEADDGAHHGPTDEEAPTGPVTAFLGDVTDRASLEAAFSGGGGAGASGPPDAIVHLAAVIRPVDRYAPVNVQGTRHMVDAATTHGVDRFVQMSVLGADPDADHPYLRSRGSAEQAVRTSGLDWTIVRPSLVYGPGDHVVSLLAEMVQGPVTPVPGEGDTRLAPIHVDDLVPCLVRALDDAHVGRVLELGGPDVVAYHRLVQHVVNRVNPRSRVRHVPRFLAKAGAWLMARRGMETSPAEVDLLFTGDTVPADNAAPGLLKEAPRGLDVGLKYLGPTGAYGEPGPLT